MVYPLSLADLTCSVLCVVASPMKEALAHRTAAAGAAGAAAAADTQTGCPALKSDSQLTPFTILTGGSRSEATVAL